MQASVLALSVYAHLAPPHLPKASPLKSCLWVFQLTHAFSLPAQPAATPFQGHLVLPHSQLSSCHLGLVSELAVSTLIFGTLKGFGCILPLGPSYSLPVFEGLPCQIPFLNPSLGLNCPEPARYVRAQLSPGGHCSVDQHFFPHSPVL